MTSSEYRKEQLCHQEADYTAAGAGIAQDPFGMYYIVQLFACGDYTITGVDEPILP